MEVAANIVWKGGMRLLAEGQSGHQVLLDSAQEFGGTGFGARPTELLLFALAGCMTIDLLLVLKKSHQDPDSLSVSIQATRSDQDPKIFNQITLEFHIQGPLVTQQKVDMSLKLSKDKYCSVYHMLLPAIQVSTKVFLNQ
ncbi:MAG: OsmC family protein [Methylacidiphilales bacterium]|nr:OsmC family protein [Candidatus Methylacidiphilales bacterium]